MMQIKSKQEYPEDNTLVFAINNSSNRSGFVGVVLFKDGKWYTYPDLRSADKLDFSWILQG